MMGRNISKQMPLFFYIPLESPRRQASTRKGLKKKKHTHARTCTRSNDTSKRNLFHCLSFRRPILILLFFSLRLLLLPSSAHLFYLPTMMLLIGIWISLTKNPMNPIIQNPTPVAIAIRTNSLRSGFVHFLINMILFFPKSVNGSTTISVIVDISYLSLSLSFSFCI